MGLLKSLFGGRAAEKWVVVAPPEGGFTIEMPTPPKVEVTDKPVPRMGLLHQLTSLPASQTALYRVQFSELSESTKGKEPEGILSELIGGTATTVESRRISLDGNPGIESADKAKSIFRRSYLVGRNLYVLLVVGMNPNHVPGDTHRFFDSFRLIERRSRARFGDFSFEIPFGWKITKTDDTTLVISSSESYAVGPVSKPDNFTLSISPAKGGTARDHLADAIQIAHPEQLERVNEAIKALGNDAGEIAEMTAGQVKSFRLGDIQGFALHGQSTLKARGFEFTYDGPRAFVVYRDLLYTIAARYSIEREAEVGPLAVEFISSMRVEDEASRTPGQLGDS